TARQVLAAAGVKVYVSLGGEYVPTPALSRAIIAHNRHLDQPRGKHAVPPAGLADGIIVTPSHNPPADGGFKYNPPHGGPAGSETTAWIARRANELIERGVEIPRVEVPEVTEYDFLGEYVDALPEVINLDAI